jgi:hypothetical protein
VPVDHNREVATPGVGCLAVEPRLLKLARRLVKQAQQQIRLPNLTRVNTLILDGIVAQVAAAHTATQQGRVDYWVKVSTLARGNLYRCPTSGLEAGASSYVGHAVMSSVSSPHGKRVLPEHHIRPVDRMGTRASDPAWHSCGSRSGGATGPPASGMSGQPCAATWASVPSAAATGSIQKICQEWPSGSL